MASCQHELTQTSNGLARESNELTATSNELAKYNEALAGIMLVSDKQHRFPMSEGKTH